MRPNELERLTCEFKPNLIHKIRRPIGFKRPGGYRKMLQQPSLELQFFIGFGKLSCPFRESLFCCLDCILSGDPTAVSRREKDVPGSMRFGCFTGGDRAIVG
jgi:hypothetical protein